MSNEMVPTQQPDEQVPIVITNVPVELMPYDPFGSRNKVKSYFTTDTPERVAQLGKAVQTPETNWLEFVGQVVTVVGMSFFTRQISKHEETPKRYGLYTAIHLDNGESIVTSSTKLLDDLPIIKKAYGEPPWPDGKPFTVVKDKTGSGRPLYTLVVGDQSIAGKE